MSDLDSDISVLILKGPLTLSSTVAVIALPLQGVEVTVGKQVIVSGWGVTYEGGSVSDNLQQVYVNIISNANCNNSYGGSITNNMLCAGVTGGGKDACQGDSGGPLITRGSSGSPDKLVGIVSWGYGCARPDYPGVYTRVSAFRTFIDSI